VNKWYARLSALPANRTAVSWPDESGGGYEEVGLKASMTAQRGVSLRNFVDSALLLALIGDGRQRRNSSSGVEPSLVCRTIAAKPRHQNQYEPFH
jgi:hypothetical protein